MKLLWQSVLYKTLYVSTCIYWQSNPYLSLKELPLNNGINKATDVLCVPSVLEINIIKTEGEGTPPTIVFPGPQIAAEARNTQQDPSWLGGGNSFKMTGKTIKELGADGQWECVAFFTE